MSQEARAAIIKSPLTHFQHQSQRDDLMDPSKTSTWLIALIQYLLAHSIPIEFTAVNTDHSDDSCLGPESHHDGKAFDCWFNKPGGMGPDYWLDAGDAMFTRAIRIASGFAQLGQVGLGGSAKTDANIEAAGPTYFADNGADHVHLSCDE